jgi:hypothetical protein
MKKEEHSFLYKNGLSIALLVCFGACLVGQIFTGHKEYNDELKEYGVAEVDIPEYLTSGHFYQATFENWESEFLQMGMYVLLTVALRQKGSSESKGLDEPEEVDREPDPHKSDAPWPVKRGGFVLAIYRNSLSIAFAILFILSFSIHAAGSLKSYNQEQLLKGEPTKKMTEFLQSSRFWFESFQNWQSEFIAVTSIVLLSIFLRQYGSPESKPVDASVSDTGS